MTDDRYDHWVIMAKISSEKQARYFGKYGAMRPYLYFIVGMDTLVDDELIVTVIENSFVNAEVEGVSYKKHFELRKDETFEYQYARMYFDELDNQYHYGKFRKITV